jgi:hypothetical protein
MPRRRQVKFPKVKAVDPPLGVNWIVILFSSPDAERAHPIQSINQK